MIEAISREIEDGAQKDLCEMQMVESRIVLICQDLSTGKMCFVSSTMVHI